MVNPQRLGQSNAKTPDWNDIGDSFGAGFRGATDAATLGLADKATSAIDATAAMARGQDWFNRYKSDRTQQIAQSQYDAQHHALAQRVGQAIGTIVGIAATDGVTAGPAASARLASLAPRILDPSVSSLVRVLSPYGAAASVGAGVSVAGQGVTDTLTNHLSSPQTYLSDAVGGAAGGVATLSRSAAAGAAADALIGGIVHADLTHKPVNFDDIEKNALGGAYLGVLGHQVGTLWADGLPALIKKGKLTKGDLGDAASALKSKILGEKIVGQQVNEEVSGGHTRLDFQTQYKNTPVQPVEAKMGWDANLSRRQKEGLAELPGYRIDHFLPPDFGKSLGGLLGVFAVHPHDDTDD